MQDYLNKNVELEDVNCNLGQRVVFKTINQTLIERIKELERFVDTIYKKNRDLEIEILNLKSFTGIESVNDK